MNLVSPVKIDIRIYQGSAFVLSRHCCEQLSLAAGDSIRFEVDNNDNIYLMKGEGGNVKGILHRYKKLNTLHVSWTEAARAILQGEKEGRYRVGELTTIDGKPALPIIRKNYALCQK